MAPSAVFSTSPPRPARDYLLLLGERWWIVMVVLATALGVATFLTLRKPTLYTATTTIELLRSTPVVMAVQDVVDRDVHNLEDLNTQVRGLESRTLIERVAKRLNGDELRRFSAPYEGDLRSAPLNVDGILTSHRRIVVQQGTLVVAITYSHPDPAVAAHVANLFGDEFFAYQTSARSEDALQAVQNLRARVEEQRQKVREFETRLQAYRQDSASVSLDQGTDIVTERLKQLDAQLSLAAGRLSELQIFRDLVVEFTTNGRPLTDIGFIAQQATVSSLRQQLAVQEITLAQLAQRYRAAHPRMIEARNQQAQTQLELDGAIRAATARLGSDFTAARRAHENAAAAFAAQERAVLELDRLAIDYDTLRRELSVNEQALQNMLKRVSETTMSASIDTPGARRLDVATPPVEPSSPDHPMDLAFGGAAGLSLGLGLAFLAALLDDRVKSAPDVSAATASSLLGLIPEGHQRDIGDEAVAALHARLQTHPATRSIRVLLVASAGGREGRSSLARQLAQACAVRGERTLLLDADLRNPSQHLHFGVENERGITDLATRSDASLVSLVTPAVQPRLDLLSTGRTPAGPTQTLGSRAFARLAREARETYDRVIIDSSALGEVSDALMLHPHIDGCLFTVRYNRSRRAVTRQSVRRWSQGPAPVIGTVVNRVSRFATGYHFGERTASSGRKPA